MRYLIEVTENYRVDNEAEAKTLIEEAKAGNNYIVKKYSSQYKEKKQKGEVVDAWYKVVLVKSFTSEKEPDAQIEIEYKEGSAF